MCKPSEFTSLTAYMLCSLLNEAGLPKGVVNMVFGPGYPAPGQALISHPHVPLVSFTGGTVTGEKVLNACAALQKKCSLELGGKNPFVVFADADLDAVATVAVRACFANQGEICLCAERMFVEAPVFDEFMAKFVTKTKEIVVIGDPKDPKSFMGPLVSKDHLNKVRTAVDRAVKTEGARILLGDGDIPHPTSTGFYFGPTILSGVSNTSKCMQEEIFGPVVAATTFVSEREVIDLCNAIPYGLAASIWTNDSKKSHRVAQAIESGVVWVNCWMVRDLRTPFGGMKRSGLGREGGDYSLDAFTEQKCITMQLT